MYLLMNIYHGDSTTLFVTFPSFLVVMMNLPEILNSSSYNYS